MWCCLYLSVLLVFFVVLLRVFLVLEDGVDWGENECGFLIGNGVNCFLIVEFDVGVLNF